MKIALLLLIAAIVAVTGLIAHTVSDNPHDFSEDDCMRCHIDPADHPKAMRISVTRMCEECHRKLMRASSHPVDRLPELATVPADLPLAGGKITCNTCHNIHSTRFSAFGQKTYFLRRPSVGREFCLACHDARRTRDRHVELVASAHIGSRFTVTDGSQPLDPMSVECISCHDGNVGSSVDYSLGQGVWNHDNGAHPIGVSYRESRMRNGGLLPVSMLDKKLRLFGGKVGCGTCHDMYSKLPKKLTKNEQFLCTSCHDK